MLGLVGFSGQTEAWGKKVQKEMQCEKKMFSANRFYIHQFSNNTAGKMPELEKTGGFKNGFCFCFCSSLKNQRS